MEQICLQVLHFSRFCII